MYYSEYKPTCMDQYFGSTSADEFKTKCIMPPDSQSYVQEKALALQFCKDNNEKCQPGMWPHLSNVYNSPTFSGRDEQQDRHSRHHLRKCCNLQEEVCRKGHCSQSSRSKPKHCCPRRYESDLEMARNNYFPGPGDNSLSVYKHKNGRSLQRKSSTLMKEGALVQANSAQNSIAIFKTKPHTQIKEDATTMNMEKNVRLSTSNNNILDIPEVPMKKPLSDTRLIGYVMFNPDNPHSCPYIASLAGIRIFPDKIEQGDHEGWAWSASEMHNLMNDAFPTMAKCVSPMK